MPISVAIDCGHLCWLRGRDLNPRPLGYEPNELPDCSTPRHLRKPNRSPSVAPPLQAAAATTPRNALAHTTTDLSGVRALSGSFAGQHVSAGLMSTTGVPSI